MKMDKARKTRRLLLKKFAVGSGAAISGVSLPDRWKRPIVQSSVLPAHAGMSGCCLPPGTYCDLVGAGPLLTIIYAGGDVISLAFGPRALGSGVANCQDGTFSIETGGVVVTVIGQFNCDSNTITGTVDGQLFTAILDGPDCPSQ